MTKGEYRVGINFNPSGDDLVNQIKRKAADFIDVIEHALIEFDDTPEGDEQAKEAMRLKALAQTHAENAAMWAVKSVTKPKPE